MRTRDTENVDYEECLKILLDENKTYGRRGKLSMAKLTERIINFRFVDFFYKAIFYFSLSFKPKYFFRDSNGETALHYATQQPNQEIIKLLLKHGANMGVKNNEGKAPVSRILPDTLDEFFNSCLEPRYQPKFFSIFQKMKIYF